MAHLFLSLIFNSDPRVIIHQDWITGFSLVVLILLAWEFVLYRNKIALIIPSFFSQRYFSQLTREGRILDERFYFLNIIIVFLIQMLAVYAVIDYFFPIFIGHWHPLLICLFALLGVIANYVFKLVSAYIFLYIFDCQDQFDLYNQYKFFYLTVNSLILFLILIFYFYTAYQTIIFFYIPIFIVIFGLLSFRLFSLNQGKINPFHFFVYFCTFEILPSFLVVKIFFILKQSVL